MRKRIFLSKRETKKLLKELNTRFSGLNVTKFEIAELGERHVYILDDAVELVKDDQGVYPYLAGTLVETLPTVKIDMGAIRFICNGADVMAPGITSLDEFEEGDYVVIRDATHGKALAIGKAAKSSTEIQSSKKGKVIKNLHYVGDDLWGMGAS